MTEQKKKPPKDEKPQIERFKEAAREIGADESSEALGNAFAKLSYRKPNSGSS